MPRHLWLELQPQFFKVTPPSRMCKMAVSGNLFGPAMFFFLIICLPNPTIPLLAPDKSR
jgi:hypothetical protein